MATLRGPAQALLTLGAALVLLSGCDKFAGGAAQGADAVADFARAALERNDQITVVAFDKKENTFTVRVKDTGELRIVRVDQIVATLPGAASDESKTRPVSDERPQNGETTAQANEPAAPSADRSAQAGESARPADQVDARNPSPPVAQSSTSSGTAVIRDARTGAVLAEGTTQAEVLDAASAKDAASGKRVLKSGPGYQITAGDRTPPSAVRLASRSTDIPSPARGVAVEKRSEPMICQGQQLLHIDGRNLEFDGDAVTAEDGCEIHITNSHIIAHGGVGISARAANVHIKNSVVEGDVGSVSASDGAQIYTQYSTFKGLNRRLDTSTFHDLGGTVWN
ncbi:MAG TPA: hypothetical protein VG994_15675 [Steroidobacteraceae bacterium]|nr:hypothetical protein [Steroidobacteraceae bacterium]